MKLNNLKFPLTSEVYWYVIYATTSNFSC